MSKDREAPEFIGKDGDPKKDLKAEFKEQGYSRWHLRAEKQALKALEAKIDTVVADVKAKVEDLPRPNLAALEFKPSDEQKRFLNAALNPETGVSIKDWTEHARIDQYSVTVWKDDPQFIAWLNREFQKALDLYKAEWLKVGLRKMGLDFKTWQEMGKIFFPNGMEWGTGPQGSRKQLEESVLSIFQLKKKAEMIEGTDSE